MKESISKFICKDCGEHFNFGIRDLPKSCYCPRCGGSNVKVDDGKLEEAGPPQWEFQCQACQNHFKVDSPKGPDETKNMVCPICRRSNLNWIAFSANQCGTGG